MSLCESKEGYYKPIKINSAFNDDCTEYESNGDNDKILTVEEYLDIIRKYLSDIINNHKTQNEWKIQLIFGYVVNVSKRNQSRNVSCNT